MSALPLRTLLIVCTALLAACTIIPRIELYNHTGSPIEVRVGDHRYTIAPEQSETFQEPGDEARSVYVCVNRDLFKYSVRFVPYEYPRLGLLNGVIRVQIDPDAQLRLLKPEEEFPLAAGTPQPEHYPLNPEREGDC